MKVLYIAGRWDPRYQDEFSGNDYGAYHAIEKQSGVEVSLVGPLDFQPMFVERLLMKCYQRLTGKRLLKYSLTYSQKSAKVIAMALKQSKPDVVFSKYSAPLAHLNLDVPLVYMCDSIVPFAKDLADEFFSPTYDYMERQERTVIGRAARVITYSQANADLIISEYNVPPEKVTVFPVPAFVPEELRDNPQFSSMNLKEPIRLLFVGKRKHLRGVDIAIETVRQLNAEGITAELRIAGMKGKNEKAVQFMGVYDKENPQALKDYFQNFRWAHLLIHPARFHAAGIVISEAAAFGLPTITNNVGGLATTTLHEQTGVVLPGGSPASSYCEAIKAMMNDPLRYQAFRKNTVERFDAELNWQKAGTRLFEIVSQVAQQG